MSDYPNSLDSIESLFSVKNDSVSFLLEDWNLQKDYLVVNDPHLFSPMGGFVTVYVEYDNTPVEMKAVTFRYAGIDGNKLVFVDPISSNPTLRPVNSKVVGNIMADHRNALVKSILNMQKSIGNRKTNDESTLEWFADLLTGRIKVPKPWFVIHPASRGFTFTPFRFEDRTYRLQSWQAIEWRWDFGDGNLSSEQHPIHVYTKPGIYTVSLKVKNDFGEREITIRDAIRVLGRSPEECDITTDTSNAIANETVVQLSCIPTPPPDSGNAISQIFWDLGTGSEYPNRAFISAIFEKGGTYQTFVKLGTIFGNYSISKGPTINVVERNSVWSATQLVNNKSIVLDEYSPIAAIWKTNHQAQSLARKWGEHNIDELRNEDFSYSGGIHEYLSTFRAILVLNSSRRTLQVRDIDTVTDSWKTLDSRIRGYGWTSSRINPPSSSTSEKNRIYMFFGHLDPENPKGKSISSSDVYDMTTETWEILSISTIAESLSDEDVINGAADIESHEYPKRFRSTNYGDKIYFLSTNESDVFGKFFSFSPITKIWTSMDAPAIQSNPIDSQEGTLTSTQEGLYFVNTVDYMAQFRNETQVWRRAIATSLWRISSQGGRILDQHTLLKSAAPSAQPNLNNHSFYATNFAQETFGSYDETVQVVTQHPNRSVGLVSAMGVF